MVKKTLFLGIIGLICLFFYFKFSVPKYLTFSDGAKIADIAKNIYLGNGYGSSFSSFGADKDILNNLQLKVFPAWGRQPLMPLLVAVSFKMFGANDQSLVLTSIAIYIASIFIVYYLARNIFSEKVGFLSAVSFIFIPTFWEYALSGASETLFILEILLTFLLLTYKNKSINIVGLLVAGLSYFTRPQGFILIIGALGYFVFTNSRNYKWAIVKLLTILMVGVAIDLLVFTKLTGKTFFYSILSKGADVSVLYTPSLPATTGLRMSVDSRSLLFENSLEIGKKIFYNIYNLYKLMPDVMPYFIFAFFVLSIFLKEDNRNNIYFKYTVLTMFILSVLSTSISIPFFRYLHPFVPLLLILSINTIYKLTNSYLSSTIVFILLIANALGVLFLDSRFISNTHNMDKPPIYVLQSRILKDVTEENDVIVTNLDTWGSWYGGRKTVWFPIEPKVIDEYQDQINYVYLTSYRMDDENYYMGDGWREILNNPQNQKILPNYQLVAEYEFNPEDNFQKSSGRSVLFVRK